MYIKNNIQKKLAEKYLHLNLMTNSFLFSIIIFLNLFGACSKSPKCWGEDTNKGIILSSLSIPCHTISGSQKNYIIKNEAEYNNQFNDSTLSQMQCALPPIDFNVHTLLGMSAIGGCNVKVIREVSKIETEKRYHYCVRIKNCGTCKRATVISNWVLVPKLPDGWTVTFDVEN